MLKAITIDFWNTLFDSSGGSVRNKYRLDALISEIGKYNINVSEDKFDEALRASWEYFNGIWKSEQRTPNVLDSINFFWNYLSLPDDADAVERLAQCFARSILYHPPNLLDGAKAKLEELSKHYKLAIISDTGLSPGAVLRELLEATGIIDYFSAFSFSDETGVSKPHSLAYTTALDALNIAPQFALHIGDIERTDVVGAKQLGMKAIRFAGDPTTLHSKDNPHETKADAEIKHWNELTEELLIAINSPF